MITERIGRHKVLLPINHNHSNIYEAFILIKTQEIPSFFFAAVKKRHLSLRVRWHALSNYLDMTHTVLLVLKSGQKSQSDLRICYSYD